MNPLDPANFAWSAPCIPCCNQPAECSCALLIPLGVSIPPPDNEPPYSTLGDAQTAIADFTADCLVYSSGATAPNSLSADNSVPNQLDLSVNVDSNGADLWVAISVADGCVLTMDWSGSVTPPSGSEQSFIEVLNCSTFEDVDLKVGTGTSGTLITDSLPAGIYIVHCGFGDGVGSATNTTCDFSISSSVDMVVNPVIALWDDSGTTRQLEACPKFLLPFLTESGGDWYASCADAQTDLTDPLVVSNCVGYNPDAGDPSGPDGFTATDGGTTLAFAGTNSMSAGTQMTACGSFNATAGNTVSCSISTDGTIGSGSAVMRIYDYTGTLLFTVDCSSGSGTSSALPYTGRYIVSLALSDFDAAYSTCTATISGIDSVNQIQALYDIGLGCAARLNCGDSCP